jgi:hypothetical protein
MDARNQAERDGVNTEMSGQHVLLRPTVAELQFQVYDRPLHPEFVDSLLHREYVRDGRRLTLDVTRSGHVVQWDLGSVRLTEVLADQSDDFPETHQLFAHRIGGERSEKHQPADGINYQTCFQVERLPGELFFHLHDELRRDGEKNGVLHVLQPMDRLGLSPLTYIDLQARSGSFLVHAYHTYPDEYAVVKTQTLIEFGD